MLSRKLEFEILTATAIKPWTRWKTSLTTWKAIMRLIMIKVFLCISMWKMLTGFWRSRGQGMESLTGRFPKRRPALKWFPRLILFPRDSLKIRFDQEYLLCMPTAAKTIFRKKHFPLQARIFKQEFFLAICYNMFQTGYAVF